MESYGGYGVIPDVRDFQGKVFTAHLLPSGRSCLALFLRAML